MFARSNSLLVSGAHPRAEVGIKHNIEDLCALGQSDKTLMARTHTHTHTREQMTTPFPNPKSNPQNMKLRPPTNESTGHQCTNEPTEEPTNEPTEEPTNEPSTNQECYAKNNGKAHHHVAQNTEKVCVILEDTVGGWDSKKKETHQPA